MSPLFRNLRIIPHHGTRTAVVQWELPASATGGAVIVAWSETGLPGTWVVRNPQAPVAALVGTYSDTSFIINNGQVVGYYKLLLTLGGEEFFSAPIGIYGAMDREDYGIAHMIIQSEYEEMRGGNGYPIWHLVPMSSGTLTGNADPDTGEVVGPECPGTPLADSGYGTPYVGGYHRPVLTWLRVINEKRDSLSDSASGNGTHQTQVMSVRLLNFPKPLRGHVLVDPMTDRRWIVSDNIQGFSHRAIYPVAYEVDVELIPQSDPVYRLVMPDFDVEEYQKLQYWE